MGEVWLARDEALGVDRAVKVLLPERAADPALRTRFTAEARTLAALGDVPGLVRVHAAGEDSATGLPYFVMDAHLLAPDDIRRVCAGRLSLSAAAADRIAACSFNGSEDFPRPVPRPFTLDDALGGGAEEDARALPERAVFAIAREIAAALDSLHLRKPPVVHRDLKPSNILFAADGRLLLADFGIAKVLDPDSPGPTLTGMQPGSHRYAAPEQREGRPATPAADWYALGVILYRALYSSFPEWGEAFPTLAGLRPVSPLWKPLLRDLLAKDPARRLANAAAFSRRLDTIERSLSSPPRRRRGVGVLLGGLGVLGALGILGFLGYLGSLDNSSPASDSAETPALSDSRTSDGQSASSPVLRAAILPPRLPDIWQGDDRGPLQLLNTFRMAAVDQVVDEALAQIDPDIRKLIAQGDAAWSARPRAVEDANRSYYHAAAKLDELILSPTPTNAPALRVCFSVTMARLSWTYVVNKEYAAADRPYKDALDAIAPLFESDPARYAPLRSWLLAERAYKLAVEKRFMDAMMDIREAANLWSRYTGETDDSGELAQMAVLSASAGALLHKVGASEASVMATAYAIDRLAPFASAGGDFPLADLLAGCHYRQGELYMDMGSRQEALQNYRRALDLWRGRYQSQGDSYRLTYAQVLGRVGDVHEQLGESREAIVLWDELIGLLSPLLASDSAKYTPMIADMLHNTALDFRRLGDEDSARAREAAAEALQPPEADKSHAEIAEASSETSGARRADPPSAGSREYTRDDIRLTPQSEQVAEAVRNDDLHEFEPSMRRRLKELLPVENPLDVVGLPPGYDAARLEQARMYGEEIANTYREILAGLYARHLSGDEPGPADLAAASIPFDEWRAWVVRQDAAGKPVQPDRKIPPASPESGTKESLP